MDPNATATSKVTINLVVIFLGVFAVLALLGVVYLIDQSKASGAEIALVSSPMVFVLGVIGGLLGNTRSPIAAQLPVVTPPEQIAAPPSALDTPVEAIPVDVPARATTLDAPLAPEDHAVA